MTAPYRAFSDLLGLDVPAADLTTGHMVARAVVVFVAGVVLVRLGHKRSVGHSSGYDVLLIVMLGSVLSRAINGRAAFWPTLGASLALVVLHSLLSVASYHSHCVSVLVKGRARVLVKDGQVDRAALRHSHVTPDDLLENLRLAGNVDTPAAVKEARIERSGTISVVPKA
ncbi:MAG TPA: YetF domain-containing protein [Opitutus sp.]|nr:YetF domain-containing protein [Opitutus sp.]